MWLLNTRHQNIPVSGTIFKVKAFHFAKELGCDNFHPMDGKSQDVTNEMTVPWRETTLPTIFSSYNSRDIFNADEFGLFYKALPKKSMHLKGEKCSGGIRSTPCRYRAQKKSWMTSELFEEWVRENDTKFALEDRKPMDQRVIRSLKCKYRTNLIKKIINAIDNGKQMPSISIIEAMKIHVYFWNEVPETTISNCFHKAGFKEGVGVSDRDEEYFPALKNSIDQLRQRDKDLVPEDFTYEDMLTIDSRRRRKRNVG
ncbi:tigger transposable element-derived protein 4-like [Hydra vulgaris]|uniref:Tigger transposable element-derived protein 4-like n=1 Tax=Hydra vulgaris TaxID=6087 RepID=A0ABM4D1B3_HYDVU